MSQNVPKVEPSNAKTPNQRHALKRSTSTTTFRNRPLVFTAQHVDDLSGKYSKKHSTNERILKLDEASLQMTNDPNSAFYRALRDALQKKTSVDAREAEELEKLKCFQESNPDLVEFLTDKEGHLKPRFDKVFII